MNRIILSFLTCSPASIALRRTRPGRVLLTASSFALLVLARSEAWAHTFPLSGPLLLQVVHSFFSLVQFEFLLIFFSPSAFQSFSDAQVD
jgi:hypothetical protein